MDNTPKKSALRTTGKVLYRVLLPISAIKTSISLVRKEVEVHKENVARIKSLGNEAKDSLTKTKVEKEVSFNEVIGSDEMHIKQLFDSIQYEKRIYLLMGSIFLLGFIMIFIIACFKGHSSGIFFSLFASFFIFGLTFILALRRQISLWQLKSKRLSLAENGDFDSFKKANPDWIKLTLNPRAESY